MTQREIKFRAWHKKYKVMIDWRMLSNLLGGKSFAVTEGLNQMINRTAGLPIDDKKFSSEQFSPPLNIFELKGVELMQYTGLKDKNGKEIYEGDVVKIKEDWDEYDWKAGEIGFIEYKKFYFGISLKSQNKPGTRYTVLLDLNNDRDVEIIGNIYENPELIK